MGSGGDWGQEWGGVWSGGGSSDQVASAVKHGNMLVWCTNGPLFGFGWLNWAG
jgi:hypothetical protein